MARRDTNADTGKTTRNGTRESHMRDADFRAGNVMEDAKLGGLAATRGAADIPESERRKRG